VFSAWSAGAARARRAAWQRQAKWAFACWRLYAREQELLRKYLEECSAAGFGQGAAPGAPAQGAVGPGDLEALYREMATQRWAGSEPPSD